MSQRYVDLSTTKVTSYELTLQKLHDYDIMTGMHAYGVLWMGYIWVIRTQKWVVFCIWDLHKKQFELEHVYGFGGSHLGIGHVQCRVSVVVYGCMG